MTTNRHNRARRITSATAMIAVLAAGTWASAQGPKPGQVVRTPGKPGVSGLPSVVPPPPVPNSPFKPSESSTIPASPPEPLAPPPKGGGVTIGLQDADLPELINWIGGLTGRRFIYGNKPKNIKVTLFSPQPVSVAEAYRAFLVALETNGLTVVPHGRFLKIIDTQGAVTQTLPIYGTASPVPAEDRFLTRMYRLQHVSADDASNVLKSFASKEGNITTYAPGNLLIVTDTGSNIQRMLRIIEEVDVGTAGEQLWVQPVYYALSSEIARVLNETFDIRGGTTGGAGRPATPGGATAGIAASTGPKATKIVADDRTNSLIIVATETSYLRMLELIKRLDVPKTGEGEIHVLPLQHAMADELAPVLNQIIGGTGGMTGAGAQGQRPAGTPGAAGSPAGGANQLPQGILEAGVRITADKATNSIIITSTLRDYAQIRNVVDKLDNPRRQVFIEAVIMDISVDRSTKVGLNYHAGAAPDLGISGTSGNSIIYGGLNPINSILLPQADQLQGLALGVRGPGLNGSSNLLGTGLTVPAFGVVLNALATSGDANVLATPHIIATDNVKAEINVGENIPLQTNVGGALGGLSGLAGAAGGAAGGLGALGALGGLGGFGAAPRADVGTKITVTPHMNDSNEVRLELSEEISERGASSGALGAVSITKRNANTQVVVRDQQTVVIGGLMRDSVATSQRKIPFLGDIPVLGFLFRSTESSIRKTNLLLVLTPYVIRNQDDLRGIFERKMQERQEFLDRYFVFSDQTPYEPPQDYGRLNGLLEDIRQAYLEVDDRKRLLEQTKKKPIKIHDPGEPIEMPDIIRAQGATGGTGGGTGGGGTGGRTGTGGTRGPAVLSPGARTTGPATPRSE